MVCTDIKPRWVSLRCEWEDHMLHRPHKDRSKRSKLEKRRWICRLCEERQPAQSFLWRAMLIHLVHQKRKIQKSTLTQKEILSDTKRPNINSAGALLCGKGWKSSFQASHLSSHNSHRHPATRISASPLLLHPVLYHCMEGRLWTKLLNRCLASQRIITTSDQQVFAKSEIILESRSGTLFVMHISRKEPSVPFAIKKNGLAVHGEHNDQMICSSGLWSNVVQIWSMSNQSNQGRNRSKAFWELWSSKLLHEFSLWQIQHVSLLQACIHQMFCLVKIISCCTLHALRKPQSFQDETMTSNKEM